MTHTHRLLIAAGAALVAGYVLARRSVLPSTQFGGVSALPPGVPPLHTDWITQARAALTARTGSLALPPSQVVLASTPIGSGYVDLTAGGGGDFLYGDDPSVADPFIDSGAIAPDGDMIQAYPFVFLPGAQ